MEENSNEKCEEPFSCWPSFFTPHVTVAEWVCRALGVSNNADYYYYMYSALGPVWAETRAQSGDWYGSGTMHPGQVLRSSLPLLSPAFRRSHFRHQVPPRPPRRERS